MRIAKGNKTALHMAVMKNAFEAVKCLIELGSDIDAKTSTGQTCLEIAKNDEIYNLLKEKLQEKINQKKEMLERKSKNNTADMNADSNEISEITLKDTEEENDGSESMEIDNIAVEEPVVTVTTAVQLHTEALIDSKIGNSNGNNNDVNKNIAVEVERIEQKGTGKRMMESVDSTVTVVGVTKDSLAAQRRKKRLRATGGNSVLLSFNEDEEGNLEEE